MLETNKNAVTVIYSGGDVQVPFLFYDAADLVVLVETTMKTMGTDYTVTGGGNTAGGKVTFMVPPTDGERVTVIRKVEFTQLLSIPPNGIIPEGALSRALDRIVMMVQQLSERADRAVEYPEGTDKNDVANAQAILDSIEQGQKTIDNAVAVAENTLETANAKFQEIVNTSAGSLQEMQGKVEEATLQAQNSKADADRARRVVEEAAYASGLANPNILINGCFDIRQAGVSFIIENNPSHYTLDMWQVHPGVGCTGTVNLWEIGRKNLKSLIGFLPQYGVLLNVAGADCSLEQRMELRNVGYEDEYVFSFLSSAPSHHWAFGYWDAEGLTAYGAVNGDTTVQATGEGMYLHTAVIRPPSFDIASASLDFAYVQITNFVGKGVVGITGCKLERGGIRTPFPPEELGDTFNKCARYYELLGVVNINPWNTVDKWCHIDVSYVAKRTTPAASWTHSDNNVEAVKFYNTSPMLNKGHFNTRSNGPYGVTVHDVVLDARF